MINIVSGNKTYKMKNKIFKALDNINMNINKAGLYLFSGESGSGKTTLLNIISGIDSFDDDFSNELPKGQAAIVYQDYQLIEHLTVYQNGLFIQEINNEIDTKKIDKILKDLDLYEWKDHKSNELSGGQKQRVAIMRALLSNKPIIIADEPTGNLSMEQANEIANILKEISKERIVLVASHDLQIFEDLADEIFYIDKGKIIKQTTNNKSNIQPKKISNKEKMTLKHIIKFATKGYKNQLSKLIIMAVTMLLSILFLLTSVNILVNDVNKIKEKKYSKELKHIELVSYISKGEWIYDYYSIDPLIMDSLVNEYKFIDYMEFTELDSINLNAVLKDNTNEVKISRVYKTTTNQNDKTKALENNEVIISKEIARKLLNDEPNEKELIGKTIIINKVELKITDIIDNEYLKNNDKLTSRENAIIQKQLNSIYLNEETYRNISFLTLNDRLLIDLNNEKEKQIRIWNLSNAMDYSLMYGNDELNSNEIIIPYSVASSLTSDIESLINSKISFKVYRNYQNNIETAYSEIKEYYISGIITDSIEDKWILNDSTFKDLSIKFGENNLQNRGLSGLSIKNVDAKFLKEIAEIGITDYTYLTPSINESNEYIRSIAIVIVIVAAMLFIITFLVILSYINASILSKKNEIGILLSLNIPLKQISLIFIIEIISILVVTFLTCVLLEFGVIHLVNHFLIKNNSISTSFVYFSLLSSIIVITFLIVITLLISFIVINKNKKQKIIDLIRFV